MNALNISPANAQRLIAQAAREGCTVDELIDRLLSPAISPTSAVPYERLLANTTDSVVLFDLEFRYLYVNPIMGTLTGRDPAEMLGRTDEELGLPQENVRLWREAWQEVIATRLEKVIAFAFVTPQGERFYESRLTPILDDANEVRYLMAITRDVTERNQTKALLSNFTEHLPGMILTYRLGPDGTDELLFVSTGIVSTYGVSVDEALTDVRNVWSRVHPDDLGKMGESIRASAETLSLWEYEWRIQMDDGSMRWIAGLGTPRRMMDGGTLWNTLLLDITDRKMLELRQQELIKQLELAIDTAHLGVWKLDVLTGHLDWNAQMFDLYGVLPEAFTHTLESFTNRVHPEDLAEAELRMQETTTKGKVSDVRFRIIRPDGEIRYVYASATALYNDTGELTGLIGINSDITAIKRSESDLQTANEMLNTIIEHIPVMIALFDKTGRFRYVNQHWLDRLGWSVAELDQMADPLAAFYPDENDRQQALAYMLAAQPGWHDFKTHTQFGTVLDTTWANVRLSDGRSIGIGQDITVRKQAEQIALEKERLTASLQLEKEHIASIQHIIATLTHDLKTPLTVIQTTKETLARYFDRINPDQRQEKLHTIGKQLEYVVELLNDLTLLTGTSLTGRSLHLVPTNLEALCQIAAQDVQASIGQRHHVYFRSDGQVQVVEVDAVLINRILLNLLSNAVKYSETGSDVWLELNRRERWIVLRVIDQGRGISPDELERIYEPFYRVSATRTIQGTGLGLSIVKDCVARHNGQISVESVVGHGTTFTVQLPLDHSNGGHAGG